MSNVAFRSSAEFIRGRNAEKLISDILQQRGWSIIPSYDYSGEDDHPPRMESASDRLILPDLDVCKDGARRWAEVKAKKVPTFGRISGKMEHGIPLRHYHDYLKVQRRTGSQVWIFIYEEDSGRILFQQLDKLTGRTSNSSIMSRGGMIYWTCDQLISLPWEPR